MNPLSQSEFRVSVCVLKLTKRKLSSKMVGAFCDLNPAKFFLAGLEENLAVIYFLLPLRGAIETRRC